MNAVKKVLAESDGASLRAQLQSGNIVLSIDGESVELTGEEVEVRLAPKPGFSAAQGKNMVVVISTVITEELKREGWVREFIRCVQDLRKEQRLAYDARIDVSARTPNEAIIATMNEFQEAISKEVLAASIRIEQFDGNLSAETHAYEIEDSPIAIVISVH